MAQVYFPPCFTAAEKGITRWDAVRKGIRQLPHIKAFPTILQSLEDYLSIKPKDLENGVRYLATDFVAPDQTRLKIYMRCLSQSFEDVWDFYTLGARISGPEENKKMFRDLMNLMIGKAEANGIHERTQTDGVIDHESQEENDNDLLSFVGRQSEPSSKDRFLSSE